MKELELCAKLRKAAREVAALDWRTSVSELEHYARIDKMDALRAVLDEINAAERALLEDLP